MKIIAETEKEVYLTESDGGNDFLFKISKTSLFSGETWIGDVLSGRYSDKINRNSVNGKKIRELLGGR